MNFEFDKNSDNNSEDNSSDNFVNKSIGGKGAYKDSDSLYLSQLKYTEKDGKTWLNFFIKNFRITVLIVIGIILWGGFSFSMLPLESMPEVKIPYGIVTVSLPGASPEDMEELVVKKIESKVASISGIKQITSSALNSFAMVSVEFNADEDLKDAQRKLRDSVANIKGELPDTASDPQVMEISFSNTPVWTIVVTGNYDNFTLRKYADLVKDEIEKLPETNEVTISGGDTYEIRVIYDPDKLQQYALSADTVNSIIGAGNFSMPLGTINVSNFEYTLKSGNKLEDAKSLRKLPISGQNGQIVLLQDVATVVEMAKERNVYSRFSVEGGTPQNAVTLNVMKKTGSSIVTLIDSGKQRILDLQKNGLPEGINMETTLDMSQTIREDFNRLWEDGLLTILLVTTLLFLFVGLKEAFVAGLAVPLVFCTTFGLMVIFGMTLNFLSLFSLILSLGLLVDDAIVVVQATKQYLKSGKFTPEEAVLLVFRDFKILLTTTTLTTIWAFLPLVLATGIIGQFIRSIPITMTLTLSSSFLIAIIINHPMAIILERFRITRAIFLPVIFLFAAASLGVLYLTAAGTINFIAGIIGIAVTAAIFFSLLLLYRKSLKRKLLLNEDLILQEQADPKKIKQKIYHHYLADDHEKTLWNRLIGGIVKMEKILPYYEKMLRSILKSKKRALTILFIVGVIFAGAVYFPASGILKSEFLPPSDVDYLYVNIEGPPGLIADNTKKIVAQVETILLKEKNIKNFEEIVGSAGVDVSDAMMTSSGGSGGLTNRAQIAINFYPFAERPASGPDNKIEKSYEIAKRLRQEVASIGGAKITIAEVSGGPPSGSDFEARIMGDDLKVVEREARKYKDILSGIPGTINEKVSITLSPGEFTIKLDPMQMQTRGLTAAQVAMTLRTAISGTEITRIMSEGTELSVIAEFDGDKISSLEQLKNLTLTNQRGQIYRLSDIGQINIGSSLTSISRIDQKRVVVISSGVEKPYLPGDVLTEFQNIIKNNPLPEGYEIKFGGATETNEESILSILWAMLVAVMLIVVTLVVQFNSFRKAILVLATIPLALTGVFYGLVLIGFTLSFPCLIGVCALFGVVVKNAVILVDKINLNLRVGIPFQDSIIDAAKSRLEAIFLTSICTIIGMIPITFADETWAGLGATLIFGLSTSTFLTLFIIPTIYNLLMKKSFNKELRLRELKKEVN
jgi:multidrug efflux pump subunit AcrB